MTANDQNRTYEDQIYQQNEERVTGADLHPRHESWARISSHSTLVGFVIFLVLAALFLLWISVRH